jgi:hypothetical protein
MKGDRSIVADALTQLGIDTSTDFAQATSLEAQADLFGHSLIDFSPEIMPAQFKQLQSAEQQDSSHLSSF